MEISIKLSSFNLTRIVTISPFYTLVNKSSLELEVGEVQKDNSNVRNKWHYISSKEVWKLLNVIFAIVSSLQMNMWLYEVFMLGGKKIAPQLSMCMCVFFAVFASVARV